MLVAEPHLLGMLRSQLGVHRSTAFFAPVGRRPQAVELTPEEIEHPDGDLVSCVPGWAARDMSARARIAARSGSRTVCASDERNPEEGCSKGRSPTGARLADA